MYLVRRIHSFSLACPNMTVLHLKPKCDFELRFRKNLRFLRESMFGNLMEWPSAIMLGLRRFYYAHLFIILFVILHPALGAYSAVRGHFLSQVPFGSSGGSTGKVCHMVVLPFLFSTPNIICLGRGFLRRVLAELRSACSLLRFDRISLPNRKTSPLMRGSCLYSPQLKKRNVRVSSSAGSRQKFQRLSCSANFFVEK